MSDCHRSTVIDFQCNTYLCFEIFDPFVPNATFPYSLKTWYFQGLEKGCIENKCVNMYCFDTLCKLFPFANFLHNTNNRQISVYLMFYQASMSILLKSDINFKVRKVFGNWKLKFCKVFGQTMIWSHEYNRSLHYDYLADVPYKIHIN